MIKGRRIFGECLVSAGLVLAVAGHWLLSWRYPSLNPFTALQPNTMDTISTAVPIYLRTAGAAAIVAADDHHATRTEQAIPLDEIFGR